MVIWEAFLTSVPGETAWGGKASCLRWEEGQLAREHAMVCTDALCSVRRETGAERVWPGCALREGYRTLRVQTQQEAGDACHHPPRLSPPGLVISCRTRPAWGLRFFICLKGVIYPLFLPHRLSLGCSNIMALDCFCQP